MCNKKKLGQVLNFFFDGSITMVEWACKDVGISKRLVSKMKFLLVCASALTLCTGAVGITHYCQTPHQVQPRVERGCGMGR